ncbi:hypothetical protein [Mesorhizobium sp. WSM4884]|uniref:hypothetical protein n=1 Tax=Mesorhizobium sp. WSM4884 TaxID=3038542 RepID=UPI0024171BC2|nr:hypothetical protein [Mesorhizobium sp. WSM4884]MDG4882769.1 hypothetical protein [Mesorhizobium sp. WSM4884]
MARRHVRHGERHVRRQHNVIARLCSRSLPTAEALQFLKLLEQLHAMQRHRMAQLLWNSASSPPNPELLDVEMEVEQAVNDWTSIPDRVFRLALQLQEKLEEKEAGVSSANPNEFKRR